jgi:hypothetical protein
LVKYIIIKNIAFIIIKPYEGWGHKSEWNSEVAEVGYEQKKKVENH